MRSLWRHFRLPPSLLLSLAPSLTNLEANFIREAAAAAVRFARQQKSEHRAAAAAAAYPPGMTLSRAYLMLLSKILLWHASHRLSRQIAAFVANWRV